MDPFKVPLADRQHFRRNAGITLLSWERLARLGTDDNAAVCISEVSSTIERCKSLLIAAASGCKCDSQHALRIAKNRSPNSSNLIIMMWPGSSNEWPAFHLVEVTALDGPDRG
jgi:hypothetical protein